jgi:hypothetical protein
MPKLVFVCMPNCNVLKPQNSERPLTKLTTLQHLRISQHFLLRDLLIQSMKKGAESYLVRQNLALLTLFGCFFAGRLSGKWISISFPSGIVTLGLLCFGRGSGFWLRI